MRLKKNRPKKPPPKLLQEIKVLNSNHNNLPITPNFKPRKINPPISSKRTSLRMPMSLKKSSGNPTISRSKTTVSSKGIPGIHLSFLKDPSLKAHTTWRSKSSNRKITTKISLIHLQSESGSVPVTTLTTFLLVARVVSATATLMAT